MLKKLLFSKNVFYVLYKNVRDPNENLSPVQVQRKPFFSVKKIK